MVRTRFDECVCSAQDRGNPCEGVRRTSNPSALTTSSNTGQRVPRRLLGQPPAGRAQTDRACVRSSIPPGGNLTSPHAQNECTASINDPICPRPTYSVLGSGTTGTRARGTPNQNSGSTTRYEGQSYRGSRIKEPPHCSATQMNGSRAGERAHPFGEFHHHLNDPDIELEILLSARILHLVPSSYRVPHHP